jgi:LysR family transcriptional regulator, flagellar master operon regulator
VDIALIHTFLEVVQTGNFIRTAERLNVTQSTVSMRIKSLEEGLGRTLFNRGKSGAALTPAGQQFRRHAELMLRLWQQARQDVALPQQFRAALVVGGQFSLWDRLLLRWLPWMRAAAPDVMLQAEVGQSADLMAHVAEGLIDIGVMYDPQGRSGLVIEKLLEERLILVSTDPATTTADLASNGRVGTGYVFVDWGADFKRQHGAAFAELETPPVAVGLGALGLSYILSSGGAGYFPKRIVRGLLGEGRLHEVADAPQFARPAFMVYPAAKPRADWLDTALAGLRHVASLEFED